MNDALQNYERISRQVSEMGRVLNQPSAFGPSATMHSGPNTSQPDATAEAAAEEQGFLAGLLNPVKEWIAGKFSFVGVNALLLIVALVLLYIALQPMISKLPSIPDVPGVPGV